jgi:hypothetical protein
MHQESVDALIVTFLSLDPSLLNRGIQDGARISAVQIMIPRLPLLGLRRHGPRNVLQCDTMHLKVLPMVYQAAFSRHASSAFGRHECDVPMY